MKSVSPKDFLDDQFPQHLRPHIPSTLRTAYSRIDQLINDDPVFQIESALDNKGRLISWAVDLGFERLIETGILPFDYQWRHFSRPTGRYLEMRAPHSIITISQTPNPKKQPRNVKFRKNARINNELLFDFHEFEKEFEVNGLPHLIITHGHQTLRFAHLCVPDPDHSMGYRYRSENLLNLPHEISEEGPPPEDTDTDFEGLGLLKEDIEKWRRDHGE